MLYLDPTTWNGSTHLNESSWDDASVFKAASDALVPVLADSSLTAAGLAASDTPLLIVADTSAVAATGVIPKVASDGLTVIGAEDAASVFVLTLVVASDTLTPVIDESRQLTSNVLPVVAADGLLLVATEALTEARLLAPDVDDALLAVTDAGATFDLILYKAASDSLVPGLIEGWLINAGGALDVVSSDALALAAVDTAQSRVITVFIVGSDALAPAVADTSSIGNIADARSATDTLTVVLTETRRLSIIDLPSATGDLPPGWTELEKTEIVGVTQPWLSDPSNVTTPQGWFPRKYWEVRDDVARIRVTDAWRNTARSQAWTAYRTGQHNAQ